MPTTISFSFELPTHRVEHPGDFVTGEAIGELAVAAEHAGFAAVHVTDHPAPDGRWLDAGGHHALDPFVALSFAAAATRSVRLLTNVYIAAYRNPFLGAKSVLSLDLLSGGRLILGTAAGYLKPEFAALGVPFEGRGARLDDALAILQSVYDGGDVAVEGDGYRARGVRFRPLPEGRAHPPVWIGGNSTTAIRRAVTSWQGWAPFGTFGYAGASRTAEIDSVDDLAERVALARSIADEVGRSEPLDICYSAGDLADPSRPVEERRDRVGRLAEAGVTWLPISVPGDDRHAVIDGLQAFSADLIT
jgi:probable F420-dependent oxidoreductase